MASIFSAYAQTGGYNPYIPQIPVDAYIAVGMAKQKLYNERKEKLLDLHEESKDYVNELLEDYPEKGELALDFYKRCTEELNRVAGKYDLTVDANYRTLRNYILQIKKYAKKLRSEARQEEREKRKE